jgi:hypothetical protein
VRPVSALRGFKLLLAVVGIYLSQLSIFKVAHCPTKGYPWKTSQFGLTSDNIHSFELVLSNGTARIVNQDEDLYFGLRVCVIAVHGFCVAV